MEETCVVAVFVLGAVVVAVVAIIMAADARRRAEALARQVEWLQRRLDAWGGAPAPPPQPTKPPQPAPAPLMGILVEQHPAAPPRPAAPPLPAAPVFAPPPVPPVPVAVAPPAPCRPSVSREALVVRAFIWIAGIALALGGAYLVKYSFDHNILTPPVRLSIGALLGVAMIAAGEWFKRGSPRIAQSLVAAGVAVLFAVVLAGVHIEKQLTAVVGFVLMGGVTAAAVVLSLRHGPFVAALGLVGGYLTPALISFGEPRPGPLFLYLFALQAGLVMVTRQRAWLALSVLTLVGGILWAASWVGGMILGNGYTPQDSASVALFLFGSLVAFVLNAAGAVVDDRASTGHLLVRQILVWGAACAAMILLAVLLGAGSFSNQDWAFLGMLGAGSLVLGRLDRRYDVLPWLTGALTLVMLAVWGWRIHVEDHGRFGAIVLALGALYALGGYACHWRAAKPASWASLSAAASVLYLMVGYAVLEAPLEGMPWWAFTALIGLAYVALAVPAVVHRARPGGEAALAALCVAATMLLSLVLPMELKRQWLTVAFALEIPALALIDRSLRVAALRWLALLLTTVVLARLLCNPYVFTYDIGQRIILNWLLYAYGVPLACLAVAAWLVRGTAQGALARALAGILTAGAVAIGFALVSVQVHHAFHRADLPKPDISLNQWGVLTTAWLLLGAGVMFAGRRLGDRVLNVCGLVVALGAVGGIVLGQGMAANPLLYEMETGSTPVLNWLLFAYGVPLLCLAPVVMELRRALVTPEAQRAFPQMVLAAGVAILAGLVALQVHHGFHQPRMNVRKANLLEWGVQTSAWMLLGWGLVRLGRWRWERVVELGGLAVAVAGAGGAMLCQGVIHNPLWSEEVVYGPVVFNTLLVSYGLPMVLMLPLMVELRRTIPDPAAGRGGALIAAVAALLLLFVLVNLEVRQAFHGQRLDLGPTESAEKYTYSAAWVVLGVALLAGGIALKERGLVLRWASLLVMILAVGKVFVFDTAHLQDLYRVFSFFGLGLTLLLLAYLYQRFVFRRVGEPAGPTV